MRLTLREREIVDILKKDPLISQDELARQFGISRSSVAVHISNLMKKGVILGKGYVFNEQVSISVVGLSYLRINVDNNSDRNIIDVDYGGLPVMAGKILAGFGVNLKIISLVGNDDHGNVLINRLLDNKIDTTHIHRHSSKRTCRRVYMNSSGMRIEEGFDPQDYIQVLNNREWIVFNSEWLIADPYFHEDIVKRADNKDEEDLPRFCTYCFMEDKKDISNFLTRYNTMVLGVSNESAIEYYREQFDKLDETSIKNYIITDGRSRLIYKSLEAAGDYPLPPNQSFDSQDGLPGLLTGVVYGLSSGYPLRQAVRIGAGFASST